MVNRRRILKTIGVSAGATSIAGRVNAGSTISTGEFSGATYDTITHQFQREARGSITRPDDGTDSLEGHLSLAGMQVEFDSPMEPVAYVDGYPKYRIELANEKGDNQKKPVVIDFQTRGENFVGTITRPGGKYGKLGFTLGPTSEDFSAEKVRSMLFPAKLSELPFDRIPSVPDTGIPRNTSPRAIAQATNFGE